MNKILLLLLLPLCVAPAWSQVQLDEAMATRLARLPLRCIAQEYPNKTGHTVISADDAKQTPAQLHPSFYGCFDWHSSVHGHWMLVHLLRQFPDLALKDSIIAALELSFQEEKIIQEAAYFSQYELGKIFERTYGWAWLLKLDEELYLTRHQAPHFMRWYQALQPLTETILTLWQEYLPKQTYPNRTGVHPNSAFGLSFAIDWAQTLGHQEFEQQLKAKAVDFYLDNRNIPAYLEPDGADFFSPSLQVADLMSKILADSAYTTWFDAYYEARSIDRLCESIVVSDRSDYQIGHLDGLMFSRAWNMKHIARKLPEAHPARARFLSAAEQFISTALAHIDEGNYGGEHWLASFAIYALRP